MRSGLAVLIFVLAMILAPLFAHAEEAAVPEMQGAQVDLILPPTLASADAPFYRGAKIKIGERMVNVTEGATTGRSLAQYDPEHDLVIVSNSPTASEVAKGQALLDVVSALQVNDIATAAGQ